MWEKIKPILASLFSSKKFLALLAGALVWALSKAGVVLSGEDLTPLLLLVGTYLGAQGIADFGKEAKKIEGETVMAVRAQDPPTTARGKK